MRALFRMRFWPIMMPMKILVVCQFYYPEHFSITDMARGFAAHGHDVLVVTGKPNYGYGRILDGYQDIEDEVIHGVRVHRCKLYPRKKSRVSIYKNYLSFWHYSRKYLRHLDEEFDVVYSMSLSPLISISGGTDYARKHHVRHILHCLDLWPESPIVTRAIRRGSLSHRILFRWSKKIYAGLDRILVSSPSFESYFRDELHVDNVPIQYVPQPPMIGKPKEVVEYDHKYNFVFAGNIGTIQLVEEVIKAVELVKNKMDVCLSLIGMGARVEPVKRLIDEKGLEDRVRFYGVRSRESTAGFFVNATAIVISLTSEGWVGKTIPGKLNAALYYGRPILACLGGDGRSVLEETGGACFAPTEDAEGIAKAMLELASKSENELEEMGRKNREYYAEHFDTEKVIEEVLKMLD